MMDGNIRTEETISTSTSIENKAEKNGQTSNYNLEDDVHPVSFNRMIKFLKNRLFLRKLQSLLSHQR